MICDCCDWESRWAGASPDDVGWCSACRTYQWRRDARLHAYLSKGGKPEKGHGCVRCEEPWGEGLGFVWHPKCRCGRTGQNTHKLVQVTPGRTARAKCSCGWTGTGRYDAAGRDEEGLDDAFLWELAADDAEAAFEHHEFREGLAACQCGCHLLPLCVEGHADRQQQLPSPREFACEHST